MRRFAVAAVVAAVAAVLAAPAAAHALTRASAASSATPSFESTRAIGHAAALAALGPRREGSAAERRAVDYCVAQLRAMGYAVSTMPFKLPDGSVSRNVIAVKRGRSVRQVLFGAHIDSKPPSPGANDNASGAGTVLELARSLAAADTEPTVVFVLFGAEEMFDRDPNHHHYGSRFYAARLGQAGRRNVSAMVSVDMVGRGTYFYARTMGVGPATLQSRLRVFASSRGAYLRYLKDTGRYGWSDHEPFERAGVPVTWLEWGPDPAYHTRGDVPGRLQANPVAVTGRLLADWVVSLTPQTLAALRP